MTTDMQQDASDMTEADTAEVDAAESLEQQSAEILAKARYEAFGLVTEARKEAESIIDEARDTAADISARPQGSSNLPRTRCTVLGAIS